MRVYFERQDDYREPGLGRVVGELLAASGFAPAPGTKALIKPNLVAPYNASLACTDAAVVRAACVYALDLGAKVSVGDSPAFATGKIVAGRAGIAAALKGLPVEFAGFRRVTRIPLPHGGHAGVAADALETDLILNLPKFKAHGQMRLTLGVKNHFGCLVGFRKALAHRVHGDCMERFASLILELMRALPPSHTLLDGITAMHITGPAGGKAYPARLLAASASAVALDTAVYGLFALAPADVPLWREAQRRNLPGAAPGELVFPRKTPADFDLSGFVLPSELSALTFSPGRLIKGRLKSLYLRLTGGEGAG
ncbi:MAG: DUF362 domain-containing protein [Desulfovibrionaceae bacterium]|nr:DUF362 domain-containing protein [Desulfovibrionaceae bacterium]MBF0513189.1 DUF362 domain-containing protein [Desulfovibrionaceae bacterium]